MKRGKTEQETLRLNGWGVGTRLVGTEKYPGAKSCVIEITYLMRNGRGIMAECIEHDGEPTRWGENTWTLDDREWVEVPSLTADQETPEEGHTWRLGWCSRSSSSVVGDAQHTDGPDFWVDLTEVVEVRAWDLRSALAKAARLPISVLMGSPNQCTNGVGNGSMSAPERCALPEGHEGDCEA